MQRIELTAVERARVQAMGGQIDQLEAQLKAWRFGLESVLQTVLGRAAEGATGRYDLSPDKTALVLIQDAGGADGVAQQ